MEKLRAAALAAWGLALVTGLAALARYDADPRGAHEAVAALGFLRGLHAWSADAALVLALLAAGRRYIDGGGVRAWARDAGAVLALAGALLAGRILTWDQHAWESLLHVDAVARLVGVRLVDPTDAASARLGLLLVLHVLLAASAALLWAGRPGARDAAVAAATVAACGGLALALPPPLGPAPIVGLSALQPDWPFLWIAPLERVGGTAGLLGALVAVLAAALLAPLVPPARRRWVVGLVALLLAVLTAVALSAPNGLAN